MKPRLLASTLIAVAAILPAQVNLSAPATKPKQYIVYVAEPQTIPANKKSTIELSFRVVENFHVNSHTPKSDLLIPTTLDLKPADDLKLDAVSYPAGTEYTFSFNPGEKLDVYTGAFTIKVPVTAKPGSHTITGSLHYQACDHAACYPPKTLPIELPFTAK